MLSDSKEIEPLTAASRTQLNNDWFSVGTFFQLKKSDAQEHFIDKAIKNKQTGEIGRIFNNAKLDAIVVNDIRKAVYQFVKAQYPNKFSASAFNIWKASHVGESPFDEQGKFQKYLFNQESDNDKSESFLLLTDAIEQDKFAKLVQSFFSRARNFILDSTGELKPWLAEYLGECYLEDAIRIYGIEELRLQLVAGATLMFCYELSTIAAQYPLAADMCHVITYIIQLQITINKTMMNEFCKLKSALETVSDRVLSAESTFIDILQDILNQTQKFALELEKNPCSNLAVEQIPVLKILNLICELRSHDQQLYLTCIELFSSQYLKVNKEPLNKEYFEQWIAETTPLLASLLQYATEMNGLSIVENEAKLGVTVAEHKQKIVSLVFTKAKELLLKKDVSAQSHLIENIKAVKDTLYQITGFRKSMNAQKNQVLILNAKLMYGKIGEIVQPLLEKVENLQSISSLREQVIRIKKLVDNPDSNFSHASLTQFHPYTKKLYEFCFKSLGNSNDVTDAAPLELDICALEKSMNAITALKKYEDEQDKLKDIKPASEAIVLLNEKHNQSIERIIEAFEKNTDSKCVDELKSLENSRQLMTPITTFNHWLMSYKKLSKEDKKVDRSLIKNAEALVLVKCGELKQLLLKQSSDKVRSYHLSLNSPADVLKRIVQIQSRLHGPFKNKMIRTITECFYHKISDKYQRLLLSLGNSATATPEHDSKTMTSHDTEKFMALDSLLNALNIKIQDFDKNLSLCESKQVVYANRVSYAYIVRLNNIKSIEQIRATLALFDETLLFIQALQDYELYAADLTDAASKVLMTKMGVFCKKITADFEEHNPNLQLRLATDELNNIKELVKQLSLLQKATIPFGGVNLLKNVKAAGIDVYKEASQLAGVLFTRPDSAKRSVDIQQLAQAVQVATSVIREPSLTSIAELQHQANFLRGKPVCWKKLLGTICLVGAAAAIICGTIFVLPVLTVPLIVGMYFTSGLLGVGGGYFFNAGLRSGASKKVYNLAEKTKKIFYNIDKDAASPCACHYHPALVTDTVTPHLSLTLSPRTCH